MLTSYMHLGTRFHMKRLTEAHTERKKKNISLSWPPTNPTRETVEQLNCHQCVWRREKKKAEQEEKEEEKKTERVKAWITVAILWLLGRASVHSLVSKGRRRRRRKKSTSKRREKHLLVIRLEVCVLIHHLWNKPVLRIHSLCKLVRLNKSNAHTHTHALEKRKQ